SFGGVDLAQDLFDPGLVRDRLVEHELYVGYAPEPQALTELPAEKRRRPLQGALGRAARRRVAERRVVEPRELQIGRDLHARQRHEPNARIVHLARQHFARFGPNLTGEPGCSRHAHVRNSTSLRLMIPGSTASIASTTFRNSRSASASLPATVTTPRPARCQRSWCSSSATATLNARSRSFTPRSTIRLSFRERAPAMCSSRDSSATTTIRT